MELQSHHTILTRLPRGVKFNVQFTQGFWVVSVKTECWKERNDSKYQLCCSKLFWKLSLIDALHERYIPLSLLTVRFQNWGGRMKNEIWYGSPILRWFFDLTRSMSQNRVRPKECTLYFETVSHLYVYKAAEFKSECCFFFEQVWLLAPVAVKPSAPNLMFSRKLKQYEIVDKKFRNLLWKNSQVICERYLHIWSGSASSLSWQCSTASENKYDYENLVRKSSCHRTWKDETAHLKFERDQCTTCSREFQK